MYARVLGITGPEPGQQAQQLVALGRLEIGAQLLLDADSELQGPVQEPAPACREGHRMGPPVGRVRAPSHEPLSLQLIDQRHHAVGMQVQAVPDGPLALAAGHGQCPQEPEMPWLDAQRLECLGQPAAYLIPQPGHGERDTRRRARRARLVMSALTWHGVQPIPAWDDGGPRQRVADYCTD
jgi:hypothetical protein